MNENINNPEKYRRIRSFVLRTGRMTSSQRHAYDSLWPKFGLERNKGLIEPEKCFANSSPVILEIGFGMGDSLSQMAQASPKHNFIGIEVHRPGVGRLLHLTEQAGNTNLRVYCDDAVEILKHCIPDQSLTRVQLFFPDPWHKKRHNKRRIIQPDFMALVRDKLAIAGVFHAATDWQPYAEHMLTVIAQVPGFKNLAGTEQYCEKPDYRPDTKFERRGEQLGHGVWDLLFKRTE